MALSIRVPKIQRFGTEPAFVHGCEAGRVPRRRVSGPSKRNSFSPQPGLVDSAIGIRLAFSIIERLRVMRGAQLRTRLHGFRACPCRHRLGAPRRTRHSAQAQQGRVSEDPNKLVAELAWGCGSFQSDGVGSLVRLVRVPALGSSATLHAAAVTELKRSRNRHGLWLQ